MNHTPSENVPPSRVDGEKPDRDAGSQLPVPSWSDVVWSFLGGLGGTALGGAIGLVGLRISGSAWFAMLALVLGATLGCTGIYVALIQRRRWSLSDLGFLPPAHSLLHLLWQVPVLISAASLAATALAEHLDLPPAGNQISVVPDALELGPVAIAVVLIVSAGVIPLIEEIIFRRVLLGWLMSKMSTTLSAVLATLVFTLCHGAPSAMLYILFFSTGLVATRLWYRTLWAPLLLHSINNAVFSSVAISAMVA
ncbi:lysostaphin resistance A-like protein [Rhodococcus sp. 077-4]|uniref:CPBP family intramembrane glutamic endopeptidase n=1 Tax=Rhodococcus sp. 077-4 TaxID=2789271 RepID=UPI0039F59CA6